MVNSFQNFFSALEPLLRRVVFAKLQYYEILMAAESYL